MSLVRSRWAAIGAALAVTLGAGGLLTAQAAVSPEPAAFVSVVPARVLDTREDLGLAGPFASGVGRDLTVTGVVSVGDGDGGSTAQEVVPAEATAIVANVTAVNPTGRGWVAVRPGDATGVPSTSSLNVQVGLAVPNSVTVGVDSSGRIELYYFSRSGGSVELVVDIVGYYIGHDHDDRYYTETEIDATVDGLEADIGAVDTGLELLNTSVYAKTEVDALVDGARPARVVWVADDGSGDYDTLGDALAAITDASEANPYLIRVAPGVYTETETVVAKANVDIFGSGANTTTLVCACSGGSDSTDAVLHIPVSIEVRDLAVSHPGGTSSTVGVDVTGPDVVLRNLSISAIDTTGATNAYGLRVREGSVTVFDSEVYARAEGTSPLRYVFAVQAQADTTFIDSSSTAESLTTSQLHSYYAQASTNADTAHRITGSTLTATTYALRTGSGVAPDGYAAVIRIDNSELIGNFRSFGELSDSVIRRSTLDDVGGNAGSVVIVNSEVGSTSFTGSTPLTCTGSYDSSFVALASDCT
jgi:hypothetical protein